MFYPNPFFLKLKKNSKTPQLIKILLIVLMVLGLSGCSNWAPITWPQNKKTTQGPRNGIHVVRPGESLFGIAFRYGYDYQEVAKLNRIPAPYLIQTGQKLRFGLKKLPPSALQGRSRPNLPQKQIEKSTWFNKFALNKSSTPKFKAIWPAKGKLIKQFDGKMNKGIDVSNRLGTPVMACQEGVVVYSGHGLKGYGNLIILKHNQDYMSAYAHNHALFVREGEHVNQGQIIAEMGNTDSPDVRLHFEIRYKGEPVEPRHHLK